MVDYKRESRLWRVRETEYCLFHLEPPLHEDADLAAVLEGADARYLHIRDVLGLGPVSLQEREGLLKLPYWLYAPSAIADADLPPGSERYAAGAGGPAGVVFAQRGFRWSELVEALTHETVHVLWGTIAGQAPSLLNEGIAEYVTRRISPGADGQQALRRMWEEVIGSGARTLRELCRNAGFWQGQRADQALGVAAYGVGGALAGYLTEVHGVATLEAIFRHTHYRDEHLAVVLERHTGHTVEHIQVEVTRWLQRPWRPSGAAGEAP